jgi:hypothetical protein
MTVGTAIAAIDHCRTSSSPSAFAAGRAGATPQRHEPSPPRFRVERDCLLVSKHDRHRRRILLEIAPVE